MDSEALIKYFDSCGLTARDQQVEVLKRIAATWNTKKYFMVSAPVGVGKTHINLAVGEESQDTYILTSEKALQAQYLKHSGNVVDIKGKANYPCEVNSDFNCDSAPCSVSQDLFVSCMTAKCCPYYNQKKKAVSSHACLTNYAYFLYATSSDPDAGTSESDWRKRQSIVMDEAHTLEDYLISVATVEFSIEKLKNDYGIGEPDWRFVENYSANRNLLSKILHEVTLQINALEGEIEQLLERDGSIKSAAAAKRISKAISDRIKKLNFKLTALKNIQGTLSIYEGTDGSEEMWVLQENVEENSAKLSPLNADFLFKWFILPMAEKFVFCSATLTNKEVFCRELGLEASETEFIEVGSPFDPMKSPIIRIPVGKMGYKDLDKTIPNIIKAVETILDTHKGDKGVIHAGTYKITSAILKGMPKDLQDRLIARDMHDDKKHHNSKLIEMHETSDDPTVLISPSMTTGIDLADDLSRFQIIVKLPWLSLADARIKRKSQLDPEWYASKMWTEILQASGRSTRSEEDWCVTYVLDSSFDWFYSQYKTKLPKWFKDRIVEG